MVNFVGVYTVIISCFLYLQKKWSATLQLYLDHALHLKKSRKLILILYFFNIPKKKGGVDMERYIEIKIAEFLEQTEKGLAVVIIFKRIQL